MSVSEYTLTEAEAQPFAASGDGLQIGELSQFS